MKTLAFSVAALLIAAASGEAAKPKRQAPASSDLQRAISFERHKVAAAARQERLDARHPERIESSAERSAEDADVPGNRLADPGEKWDGKSKPKVVSPKPGQAERVKPQQ